MGRTVQELPRLAVRRHDRCSPSLVLRRAVFSKLHTFQLSVLDFYLIISVKLLKKYAILKTAIVPYFFTGSVGKLVVSME